MPEQTYQIKESIIKRYWLIDTSHEKYYVGRIFRSDDEVLPEVTRLKTGEVFQISERYALQRD